MSITAALPRQTAKNPRFFGKREPKSGEKVGASALAGCWPEVGDIHHFREEVEP